MTIKVGINGMGRIGRMVVRSIIESKKKNIIIKHINNRSNAETTCALIKYDSVHGKFNANLRFDENNLIINDNNISFSRQSNLDDINWKKFEDSIPDMVRESLIDSDIEDRTSRELLAYDSGNGSLTLNQLSPETIDFLAEEEGWYED